MAGDRKRELAFHLLLYVHVALIIDLWVSLFYFAIPAWKSFLVDEDRLLEILSALLNLSVFIYALLLGIRAARQRNRGWIWPAFLTLVGLWSFLEEMSYGRRIFGFGAPRTLGVEIDGLHDYVLVGKHYLEILITSHPRRLAVLVVILGLAALALAVRYRSRIWALLRLVFSMPTYLFFGLYVLLMVISQLLDMGFLTPHILVLLEEIAEFDGSLALLFSCIAADGASSTSVVRFLSLISFVLFMTCSSFAAISVVGGAGCALLGAASSYLGEGPGCHVPSIGASS
jgi:hypothetical protein